MAATLTKVYLLRQVTLMTKRSPIYKPVVALWGVVCIIIIYNNNNNNNNNNNKQFSNNQVLTTVIIHCN